MWLWLRNTALDNYGSVGYGIQYELSLLVTFKRCVNYPHSIITDNGSSQQDQWESETDDMLKTTTS
jgi:hypothetical protein